MPAETSETRLRLRWIATAILSLLLYAGAVWSSDQHQKSQFAPEQMIILSALAHAVHGTPIGSVYQGFIFSYVYRPAGRHMSR